MRIHFGYILGLAALALAGTAAYFSVYGIGKLFQGAFWAVVVMASALEFAKLVGASFLQRYWKSANIFLKVYLVLGVTFLMGITSGGIYGFLSSAYQETFQELAINENEIKFLEGQKKFYEDDVARFDIELAQINDNITKLSEQGVNSIQVRDENSETGFRNTISTAGLRAAQKRIDIEDENKTKVRAQRKVAADSLRSYETQILTKQNSVSSSGELGPLKYIANLTDIPMDKVVNWFILLFIFVFDPMAVTLVIATNWVFEKEGLKRKRKDENATPNTTVKPEKKKLRLFSKLFSKSKVQEKKVNEGINEGINDAVSDAVSDAVNDAVNDAVSDAVSEEVQKSASTKSPTTPPGVVVKKTPQQTGIKPEDIAQVRKNAKNLTRKIPARRGY